MAKTMTAFIMTPDQIEDAVNKLRDAMRKHRTEISREVAQQVLGLANLGMMMFSPFRERADAITNMITRHVSVNRNRSPEDAIKATGRTPWYIDQEVLSEMPREGRAEDDVFIFELDYDPTVDELDHEYEVRGLRPDPYALAQAMADDPAIADERPVATQWRDKRGRACFAIFHRYGDGREVSVYWLGNGWGRSYRFAGVRK